MDNAILKLTKAYRNSTFDGFGIKIHPVPHDTDSMGYDRFPEGAYKVEYAMISKPHLMSEELKLEYKLLVKHCSTSLYRIEFKRCKDNDCPLCRNHKERECPLNDFFSRFPNNQVPAPIPVLPPFPPEISDNELYSRSGCPATDVNARLEGFLLPIRPKDGRIRSAEGIGTVLGHYRTFRDLLQSRLPRNCPTYATDYYRGSSKRINCSSCSEPHILRSEAAYKRHCATVHDQDADSDIDDLESDMQECELDESDVE